MSALSPFWSGFEKRANAPIEQATVEENRPPQHGGFLRNVVLPGAAAAAAGLGAYKLLRRGGRTLTKAVDLRRADLRKARPGMPVSRLEKMMYGADDIVPTGAYKHKTKDWAPGDYKPFDAPAKAKKVDGAVLYRNPEAEKEFIRAKDPSLAFGDPKGRTKNKFYSKETESRLLNQTDGKAHTPTRRARVGDRTGKESLKALHKQMGDKGYIIKPSTGADSGVGGVAFLTRKDVEHYLSGGKLEGRKQEALKGFFANPDNHILQHDMGIKKDLLTGGSREFRVHVLNGKVVPGATSIRDGNVTDLANTGRAEKFMQGFVNKMPRDARGAGSAYFPDVAMTRDGFKVVEMNGGGGLSSGFTNPSVQYRRYGGIKGLLAGANSVRTNQAIYKHITGRDSQLSAGAKALAAAGAAGGATAAAAHQTEQ